MVFGVDRRRSRHLRLCKGDQCANCSAVLDEAVLVLGKDVPADARRGQHVLDRAKVTVMFRLVAVPGPSTGGPRVVVQARRQTSVVDQTPVNDRHPDDAGHGAIGHAESTSDGAVINTDLVVDRGIGADGVLLVVGRDVGHTGCCPVIDRSGSGGHGVGSLGSVGRSLIDT